MSESVLVASIGLRLDCLAAIPITRRRAPGVGPLYESGPKIEMRLKIPKLLRQIGTVLICLAVIYAVARSKEGFDDYIDQLKAARGYPVPSKPMIDRSIQASAYLRSQTTCPDGTQKTEHVAGDCAQDLIKPYTYVPNLWFQNPFSNKEMAEGQQCYFNKDCYSGNCYNFRCLPPRSPY